ncbi:NAD-dependent epimerase/dehydratase family protein [Akkermansia sp.]|uniref:NAD-dependent epimerase/dehydratase family protein n=1 Tax=Akkermansia sp. TaxID=1872421 RepID=UPI003991A0AA
MDNDSRIFVAGHRGLVGSAIWKALENKGYSNLIGRTHRELDLEDPAAVREFFDREKPEYVFLAAAFVGGIIANSLYRADFIFRNLQIQQNVIGESFRHGVSKLLFLGSTCIYPREAPQPMKEDALLTSPLEYTNEPYAIAKIAGLKMCESFNLQYGTNYIAVMPTNRTDPTTTHLENSHVLPAMVRKIQPAKCPTEGNWALSGETWTPALWNRWTERRRKRPFWPCWANTASPPVPWNCGERELPCANSCGARIWRTPASM